ncbi:hypothetical protein K491DRAFT_687006 [Lophiostoma macrostomum CBS 122681]|uniref:Uncharacterized protein n=1 Tax=Lophiostoma macrostomum CBS 122681 TaxID=1314788 RepID=A0A6A6TQE5_9PLEO|nr:hypothetical protein K491DRAFT_687006 [Lophiostoma macrostomum CBS 122681]
MCKSTIPNTGSVLVYLYSIQLFRCELLGFIIACLLTRSSRREQRSPILGLARRQGIHHPKPHILQDNRLLVRFAPLVRGARTVPSDAAEHALLRGSSHGASNPIDRSPSLSDTALQLQAATRPTIPAPHSRHVSGPSSSGGPVLPFTPPKVFGSTLHGACARWVSDKRAAIHGPIGV